MLNSTEFSSIIAFPLILGISNLCFKKKKGRHSLIYFLTFELQNVNVNHRPEMFKDRVSHNAPPKMIFWQIIILEDSPYHLSFTAPYFFKIAGARI
ncbi:hypothetical protein HMP0721_1431 [Pseudoramibacter alactolyticus ATCC 23263]|uniref:Uncharacterized protein n=1 Tax=Pseudoramibacter alactolyticus ATCC 23263 TaxID=887929 RepID=E6MHE6_9FIRM|nr:hypothetical protein HMP0721_1431 [Pseudoramibacter alactolyticus ATCC 23263]